MNEWTLNLNSLLPGHVCLELLLQHGNVFLLLHLLLFQLVQQLLLRWVFFDA